MNMNIYVIGLLVLIIFVLLLKYLTLRDKNRYLKRENEKALLSASTYFNLCIQYRDIILKSNIAIPNGTTGIPDNNNTNKPYTVDDILDEIAEKGIKNISEDKLNFLKNKNDDKK